MSSSQFCRSKGDIDLIISLFRVCDSFLALSNSCLNRLRDKVILRYFFSQQHRLSRKKISDFPLIGLEPMILRLLQAIVKRVDTLPVIGYVSDAHHCIACFPPSPYQCCTKFAMTFNQASLHTTRI